MAELESVIEKRLIDQLCCDESQWTYRPDIRTEEQLWNHFKYILEQNNKAKLNDNLIHAGAAGHMLMIHHCKMQRLIPSLDMDIDLTVFSGQPFPGVVE